MASKKKTAGGPRYPRDSAGSLMAAEFVTLWPDMTVAEARRCIRHTGVDRATINTCYVAERGRLVGALSLRAIVLASAEDTVGRLMARGVISVSVLEDQETVARVFAKYDFNALPVVDAEARLVGVITADDVMAVLRRAATEDLQRMSGAAPSQRPYLQTGAAALARARLPWLMVLMLSATLTGLIISRYQAVLSACLALSAFIPMLSDSGGNSGTQSGTAVIRGIALGELRFADLGAVVWKEARVALLCGGCLAAVNFLKIWLVDDMLLHSGTSLTVALAVSLTLVCVVFLAKVLGGSLPLLANAAGLDPAMMAGPLVTTVVDALSLLVYFRIATVMLRP